MEVMVEVMEVVEEVKEEDTELVEAAKTLMMASKKTK